MNSMFDQNPVGGRSTENACLVSFCSCRRPLLHVFSIATWLHMWNRHIVHRNWNGPLDLCSRNMWSWVYILQTNRFADTLLFHVGNIWYILMLHLAQGFQDWTWTNNTGNLNTSSVHTSLLKPDSLRLNSSRMSATLMDSTKGTSNLDPSIDAHKIFTVELPAWCLHPEPLSFHATNYIYIYIYMCVCSWTNDSRCLWTLAKEMMLDGLYLEHVLAEIVWTRRNCEGFIIYIVLEQEYTSSCGPTFDIFYCSIVFNPPAWPAIHSK